MSAGLSGSNRSGTPQELLEAALAAAAGPVVAVLTERFETNLRWAANALTTNGEMHARSLAVTAITTVEGGTATATVVADVVSSDDAVALVTAAEAAAAAASPAPEAIDLVEPYATTDVYDEAPETTGIDTLSGFATALGRAFVQAVADDTLLWGFAEHAVETVYLASSTGLRRRGVDRAGRLELNAKSADLARSAWVGQATQTFADVDVDAHYAELVRRLGWARRSVELPPGRYETLLPPGAVADLMIYAWWTANARDAEDGSNVYAAGDGRTRIGERLTELPVTLLSDPAWPGEETLPFVAGTGTRDGTSLAFDLGTVVPAVHWLEDGRLTQLVRNRAHAAATGQSPTPPAPNLVLAGGGTATLDDMIAGTERGLLLTCFWYIREVDPERLLLTGLTRDGVYLVEQGEVVAAVNNFRWNESPLELLGRASEVGASQPVLCREWNDWVTKTVMPPLRIPDFTFSTVSQAS